MPQRSPDRSATSPRARLHEHGVEALTEAELLALILRTGEAKASAHQVALRVLVGCGGLPGLARSSRPELARISGVGEAKSASLLAALELGQRLHSQRLVCGSNVAGPGDVYRHFHPILRHARQECFAVLLLDGRQRALGKRVVSRGTLTASLVHPREVFRPALAACAAALVLVHNHPSGDPTPSEEDCAVTRRLVRAGELLGVRVVDHIVVAESGYVSLRDEGLMGEPPIPNSELPADSGLKTAG